jgi:hypothetical protein
LEEKMDIMGVVPALLSYLCGVGTKLKGGGMDYQVGTDQFHEICHDIWVYYGIFYHIIGSHIVYIYICISHFPLDPILRSGKRISSIKKLVGVDPRSDHESMVDWRITSSIPRW